MSKVREVYFYTSWLKGRDPFDAHMMTHYNNKDGIRVPVPNIDKARDIARQMVERNRETDPSHQIHTGYGLFFMEEFDDDTTD